MTDNESETDENRWRSPVSRGLSGRCPRCGHGKMFRKYLKFYPQCPHCGLDFSEADTGDAPAVFLTLIIGLVVVAGAVIVEIAYKPPYWVHAALWLPATIGLTLLLLQPTKGLFLAVQLSRGAREGRIDADK